MDIFDKAFHLPLLRPLPNLSQFGLVPDPEHRDVGRLSWVAIADGRSDVMAERTCTAVSSAITGSRWGQTLDGYLSGQLERLRAEWAAVAPVRLYLRAPNERRGRWTRAWVGLPRSGLTQHEATAHLHDLLERLSSLPNLVGYTLWGRYARYPDRKAQPPPSNPEWLRGAAAGRKKTLSRRTKNEVPCRHAKR